LQLNAPEIDGRQLRSTWQLLHDSFVCRPQAFAPSVHVDAEEVVIRNSTLSPERIQKLSVGIFPQADETQVIAKFLASNSSGGSTLPATLMIDRGHRESQLFTRVKLITGDTGLPCSLLAPLFPKTVHLGQRSAVVGTFELTQRNSEWRLEISDAWLQQVDIGSLPVTPDTRVTGEGALKCVQAIISHRGLQEFVGAAYIDQGRIDRGFLVAAQQYLGVHLIRDVQTASTSTVMFDRLRFGFSISPQKFQLKGFAEHDPGAGKRLASGTLLADALGEIAVRTEVIVPLQNVVALLSRSSSVSPALATSSPVVSDEYSENVSLRQALRWLPLH
jgi:hypothetical protein